MYDDLAYAYIRLLRQACPQAAAQVERMRVLYGTQFAVRAAVSLVLTMNYMRRVGRVPEPQLLLWTECTALEDNSGAQRLYDLAQDALIAETYARS